MKSVKVYCENGSNWITSINGTYGSIRDYFLGKDRQGKMFNTGIYPTDTLSKTIRIQIFNVDLKFSYMDVGNCRAYFKDEYGSLYCLQEEFKNYFEFYRCSKDGEPNNKVTRCIYNIAQINIKNDKYIDRFNKGIELISDFQAIELNKYLN